MQTQPKTRQLETQSSLYQPSSSVFTFPSTFPVLQAAGLQRSPSPVEDHSTSGNHSIKDERNSKEPSYLTEETRFTKIKSHSLQEEGQSPTRPLPSEVDAAKRRYSKLHGRNFGRSLTLEQSICSPPQASKYKLVIILVVCGAIVFGSLLAFRARSGGSEGPGVGKRSRAKRRGSKI